MQGVATELLSWCAACDTAFAINAVVPGTACPACERGLELDAAFWNDLFAAASTQIAPHQPGFEVTSSFTHGGRKFRSVLRRSALVCPRCQAALALPSGVVPAIACACGLRLTVRADPAWKIAYVVGDAPETMQHVPGAARMLHCPACGAPLDVPRDSSVLHCAYCGKQSILTEQERRTGRPMRRFYLACDVPEAPPPSATWKGLLHLAVDEHARLYLLEWDDGFSLLALDTSLRGLRWAKRGIDASRFARVVAGRGVVAVVDREAPATVFREGDGEPVDTFPPRGSSLDPTKILSSAILPDGTWLVAIDVDARGSALLRTDDRGDVRGGVPQGDLVPLERLAGSIARCIDGKVTVVGGPGTHALVVGDSRAAKLGPQGRVERVGHPRLGRRSRQVHGRQPGDITRKVGRSHWKRLPSEVR